METKICCKCKRELPIDNFYKDNSRRDKLGLTCKWCIKKYQEKNKDRIKASEKDNVKKAKYMKIYRLEHKAIIKEQINNWKKKNKDKIKQYKEKMKEKRKKLD